MVEEVADLDGGRVEVEGMGRGGGPAVDGIGDQLELILQLDDGRLGRRNRRSYARDAVGHLLHEAGHLRHEGCRGVDDAGHAPKLWWLAIYEPRT